MQFEWLLLAESGPSSPVSLTPLNVRYRRKQTFRMAAIVAKAASGLLGP